MLPDVFKGIQPKMSVSSTSPKYQGTEVSRDDSRSKALEPKVIPPPSKAPQPPVKKVSAPVKSPKLTPSNPFEDEDSYDPYESKNPFAEDYDSPDATDVTKPTANEGSSTNPFDEPDDYDKEKNPFAT